MIIFLIYTINTNMSQDNDGLVHAKYSLVVINYYSFVNNCYFNFSSQLLETGLRDIIRKIRVAFSAFKCKLYKHYRIVSVSILNYLV